MASETVTEKQVLDALHQLEPHLWGELLDFIAGLKQRTSREPVPPHTRPLTASDLLHSELVGSWAERSDIDDSALFARELRQQAEHRRGKADDLR